MKALVVLPFIRLTDCDYWLQAGRIYRSWACLEVKNKGDGSDLIGGSFSKVVPPNPSNLPWLRTLCIIRFHIKDTLKARTKSIKGMVLTGTCTQVHGHAVPGAVNSVNNIFGEWALYLTNVCIRNIFPVCKIRLLLLLLLLLLLPTTYISLNFRRWETQENINYAWPYHGDWRCAQCVTQKAWQANFADRLSSHARRR